MPIWVRPATRMRQRQEGCACERLSFVRRWGSADQMLRACGVGHRSVDCSNQCVMRLVGVISLCRALNRLLVSAGPLEGVSGGARLCVTAADVVVSCLCNPLCEAAWRCREVRALLCAPAMGCLVCEPSTACEVGSGLVDGEADCWRLSKG